MAYRMADVKLRGKKCLCRSCGLVFGAISTFDMHRYGPWTDRRCLDAIGMLDAGMYRDPEGVWRKVNTWAVAA